MILKNSAVTGSISKAFLMLLIKSRIVISSFISIFKSCSEAVLSFSSLEIVYPDSFRTVLG